MTSSCDSHPYSIPGVITLETGNGGLPRLAITTERAEAHIYLHGAHVTHYQPRRTPQPVLWMSAKSLFEPGKAIRGGVPLIFPWFGPHATDKSLPAHGFARTQPWLPVTTSHDNGRASVTLELRPNDDTRKLWPHEFEARYTVTVAPDALDLALEIRNLSAAPFTFEEAFHTYLTVGDVRRTELTGLGGRTFLDKMDAAARKTQSGPIRFTGETDRVYVDTPDAVTVNDPVLGRTITVAKDASLATVIWNPWIEKAKRMADFGDDEWPAMVCVETANCADHVVTLASGESHVMRAKISMT
jgi:glucose-6-phosphate 1-epimerase